MKLKPLNRRDVSKILKQIGEEYGCDAKKFMIEDYTFFISEKDKVYIITNEIKEINMDALRINSMGLYFCELNRENIRLSMEGSHIIGKIATKNILEVDDKTSREWLKGIDIDSKQEFDGFVIIKHNNDLIGCGKYKENKILNYVTKARRVMSD